MASGTAALPGKVMPVITKDGDRDDLTDTIRLIIISVVMGA